MINNTETPIFLNFSRPTDLYLANYDGGNPWVLGTYGFTLEPAQEIRLVVYQGSTNSTYEFNF
jgi:hypothetical protein